MAYGSPRGVVAGLNFGVKMSEPRAFETPGEEEGETLVTPRFDEEETVLAQPVVPLDAEAEAAAPYAPSPRARRQQWPLALILISALAGSVVGGTALYFFQKQRLSKAAPAAVETEPAAAPQPSPTAEETSAAAPEPSAPAVEAEEVPAEAPAEPAEKKRDDAGAARRAEPSAAPAPPVVKASAPKRGKKAESEDDDEPRPRRTPRADDARPGGARRVDTITYPTRRAERRTRREERRAARDVDRVRAIFEGQP